MRLLNKFILLFVVSLALGTVPVYSQDAEKTPDSTDSALVDGVKQIQDTNVENKMKEMGDEFEDQGLEVEVENRPTENTVTEDTATEGAAAEDTAAAVDTAPEQVDSADSADLGGINPDLMLPQPRIKIEDQIQKPLYNAEGKRDPFKPFIKTPKEKQAVITATTPPLKRFPLDEYRITGIIWIENVPNAMVVDPEGNTYVLTTDDEIGNRNGVILEVNENGMLVSEKRFFEDVFGEQKVEVKQVVLAFVKEDEN